MISTQMYILILESFIRSCHNYWRARAHGLAGLDRFSYLTFGKNQDATLFNRAVITMNSSHRDTLIEDSVRYIHCANYAAWPEPL